MERRHFLSVTAAGALGWSLSGAVLLPLTEPTLSVLARPELLTLLNGRVVSEIGMAYRTTHRQEDAAETLVSAILAGLGQSADPPDGKRSTTPVENVVGKRLAQQIKNDFATHRTVQLNGWILSLTEARQCALYSIASGGHL